MKQQSLKHLIDQEKLLYVEVEQLRSSLYLHDSSLIFEFFSAFYFAGKDIQKLFRLRKEKQYSSRIEKYLSINSLLRKKKWLHILSKSPYAYLIYFLRYIKRSVSSTRHFREVEKRPTQKKAGKQSFIIFGTSESSDLQSRSVQIARKLAEKIPVTYIEGVFDEGSRSGSRIIESSTNFTAIRLTTKKSIHLNYQNPTSKEITFLKKSLGLSTLRQAQGKPFDFRLSTLYLHHPFWSFITPIKKNSFYFDNAYDFVHTYAGGKHIVIAEKKCIKNAKVVTAPHKKLLHSKKDEVIRNGVEWEAFKDTSKMIQTCDVGLCWIKKPVMGYIGTLDEKIDEELLGKLAAAFPSASIVLVGNTDYRPVIEIAEKAPNIFPVGKQPYKKLSLFLQSFDILISPFKYNKTTVFNHPEFPLYLTSGKPLVYTAMADDSSDKGLCYTPKSHTDWTLAISDALKEKKRSKKRSMRIAAAKKLTWSAKPLL